MRHRDDAKSTAIQKQLESLEHSERPRIFHRADNTDGFWPEIAQFKDERTAFVHADNPCRYRREKLWRCSNDYVNLADEERRDDCAHHVTDVIQDAALESLIRCDVCPHSYDTNAIHLFGLPKFVLIAFENFSFGKIRGARDHSHALAVLDPFTAMFKGSRSRRIDLGRKVVCQKKNVHFKSRAIPMSSWDRSLSIPRTSFPAQHRTRDAISMN